MSWWKIGPEPIESANESYFLDQYPLPAIRAFIALDSSYLDIPDDEPWRLFQEYVEEAMVSFAQKWGGLDDATFLRVLEEGRGRERLLALFAIGHSQLPQAADLLAPFLGSGDALERCAAACLLTLKRDERALPVLEEYFLQDPPRDGKGQVVRDALNWYEGYQGSLARQLANWGPASLTPILRAAFLKVIKEEREGKIFLYHHIHDALSYALGRRGALGSFHGIDLSSVQEHLSQIFLAFGYLRANERFEDLETVLVLHRELREEVAHVLQAHFALSEQESHRIIASFGDDYEERETKFWE